MKKATAKKGTRSVPARDIDEYLAGVLPEQRAALEKLRKTIRAAAPKAEEVISYQIPAYKHGGMLVFFAAFRDHCSFFPASKAVLKEFSAELAPFRVAGSTIHFSPEKPLPAALVRKIVKRRVEENEARLKRKETARRQSPK